MPHRTFRVYQLVPKILYTSRKGPNCFAPLRIYVFMTLYRWSTFAVQPSYKWNTKQSLKLKAITSETTAACSSSHTALQTKKMRITASHWGKSLLFRWSPPPCLFEGQSLLIPLWLSSIIKDDTICHASLMNLAVGICNIIPRNPSVAFMSQAASRSESHNSELRWALNTDFIHKEFRLLY